jgi:integrase
MKFNYNLRPLAKGQTKKDKRLIYFVSYFPKNGGKYKFVYSTGFHAVGSHWNPKEQRVKNILAATNSQIVNNFLNDMSSVVSKWGDEQLASREPATPKKLEAFLDEWTGKTPKDEPIEMFPFIKKFIDESHLRLNPLTKKNIALGTVKKYRATLVHLEAFVKLQKRKTLDFQDMDINFYNSFLSYLTNDRNMKPNTIGKHTSVVKTFLSEAESLNIPVPQAYKGRYFKTLKEDTENVYLAEMELKQLETLDLSDNSRLDRVRDLFLIGAWTGLRFSDFTDITGERIVPREKGGYDIRLKQHKTGGLVVIPCNDVVMSILKKYDFNLPPAISNQKFNLYLKELCQIVGFDNRIEITATKGGKSTTDIFKKWELISTHTARRSYATNAYKRGQTQIKSIMKITGHKTEASFYKYIVLSNDEHAEIVRENFEKQDTPLLRVA